MWMPCDLWMSIDAIILQNLHHCASTSHCQSSCTAPWGAWSLIVTSSSSSPSLSVLLMLVLMVLALLQLPMMLAMKP